MTGPSHPPAPPGRLDTVERVARQVLARAWPDRRVRRLHAIGAGLEHTVFEVSVEGVDADLVVRVRREPDPVTRAEAIRREAALLTALVEWSTLPVPRVLVIDAEAGALVHERLPGRPLLHHPLAEPTRLAPVLGAFLTRLHAAPLDRVADLVPVDDDAVSQWHADLAGMLEEVRADVPPVARPAVDAFVGAPPPPPVDRSRLVLCHNDLGAEHVLVDPASGAVTGVIDWSDAAAADPMADLGRLRRDLGPVVIDEVVAHYDHPCDDADRARIVFYARASLLEDLVHGLRSGDRRYRDRAREHLDHTFA